MIYCPNCGTPNDDGSKVCSKCGTSLSFPEMNPGFSTNQQNAISSSGQGSGFGPQNNNDFAYIPPVESPKASMNPKNKKLLIILSCLVLGIASLGISFFFGLNKKDSSSTSSAASREKTEDKKTEAKKAETASTQAPKKKASEDKSNGSTSSESAKAESTSSEVTKADSTSSKPEKNDASSSKKEESGTDTPKNKDFWNPTEHLDEAIDAYAAKIRKDYSTNNNVHWCLAHINGDVIPELIISDTFAHMCTSLVYTFTEEGLTELQNSGSDYGCFNFVPNQNRIISDHFGNGGYSNITVYEMKDGQSEEVIAFFEDQSIKGPAYEINGKAVSASTFNDKMNQYCKGQYHLEYDDMYPVFDGSNDKVQDLQEHYSYYLKE